MIASWVALVLLAQSPSTPEQRAVILPVRVSEQARPDVRTALPAIEEALSGGLARHAGFHVVTRTELAAALGSAAKQQLMGCDAESCVTEVADALGAELVVVSALDVAPGLWSLQCSLVQRRDAAVLRRAGVKARSLDALMASLDQIARQLAGGAQVSASDPQLATRLGTDDDGTSALQRALRGRTDADVSQVWTDVILERNGESEALALAEGGVLLVGGWSLATAALLAGALTLVFQLDQSQESGGIGVTTGAALYLVPLPFMLLGVASGMAALALFAIDALDVGRIRVARGGCCRDEDRVRGAKRPGVGRWVGPVLAGLGTAFAVAAPGLMLISEYAASIASVGIELTTPLRYTGPEGVWFTLSAQFLQPTVSILVFVPYAALCLVAAIGMMFTGEASVIDDDEVAIPVR